MLRRFRNATFCPCPFGDNPNCGLRFYWALLSMCIPVLFRYDDGGLFKPRIGASSAHFTADEVFPFTSQVKYEDIVMEVPVAKVEAGEFLEILEQVPENEIIQKRHA